MQETYKIGEVASKLNLKTYVLRFWETEFPQVEPLRTEKGQRLYTPEHVGVLQRIRHLLHERGLTIDGARRVLAEEISRGVVYSQEGSFFQDKTWLGESFENVMVNEATVQEMDFEYEIPEVVDSKAQSANVTFTEKNSLDAKQKTVVKNFDSTNKQILVEKNLPENALVNNGLCAVYLTLPGCPTPPLQVMPTSESNNEQEHLDTSGKLESVEKNVSPEMQDFCKNICQELEALKFLLQQPLK